MAALIITSAKKIVLNSACLSVCRQNYSRSFEQIFIGKLSLGIRSSRLNFEVLHSSLLSGVVIVLVHLTLKINKFHIGPYLRLYSVWQVVMFLA